MYKLKIFILILLFFVCKNSFSQSGNDIENVRQKLKQLALQKKYRDEDFSEKNFEYILSHLSERGKWDDIDYSGKITSSWEPAEHWKRLYEVACAYNTPKTIYYQDSKIENKIIAAIEVWNSMNIKATNDWWTYMGVPLAMGKVLILMDDKISKETLATCLLSMNVGIKKDYYDYHGKATGQNLLWLAYTHIYISVLQKNVDGLTRAFFTASEEIKITTDEGIQPDYSFHQHGAQFYSFGYGRTFSLTASHLAFLSFNTSWAWSNFKIAILSDYILKGQQWMTRNLYLEYTAMGREIARKNIDYNSLIFAAQLMSEINSERKIEFAVFASQLKYGFREKNLIGNKYYPYSDFMVHQRKGYLFSLKAASNRILSGESGNGENIKGFYQGNGTYYLVRKGDEYKDIFPFFNWKQLPGLLAAQSSSDPPLFDWGKGARGNSSFVFGVSDGLYGCFGNDYRKEALIAKRAWFLFDKEIVCLAAGISDSSGLKVTQSINQCLLKTPVIIDGKKYTKNSVIPKSIKWVYHDSIAYIFPSNSSNVELKTSIVKSSWNKINLASKNDTIESTLFSLLMNVGVKPTNQQLSYIILPGLSILQAKKVASNLPIKILQNDSHLQSVYHATLNMIQIVVYDSGTVKMPWSDQIINIYQPALIILKKLIGKYILTIQQDGKRDNYTIDANVPFETSDGAIKIYKKN